MQKQYFKEYSPALGRDMEGMVYGHAGRPMLFIPCQDGHHPDFEGFHMTETLAPWIESGQIQVTSIDTKNADRDAHIRSADFFDAEQFPTATFRSTGVRTAGSSETPWPKRIRSE